MLPRRDGVHAGDLPTAQQKIERRRHRGAPPPIASKGQLDDQAGRVVIRLVILAQTPLGVQVVDILRSRRRAVGEFERLRAVVLRLRQRERIQHPDVVAHAPLVADLQAVVAPLPTVKDVGDVAVLGNRPCALRERNRPGRIVRRGLVVVGDRREIIGPVADVGDIHDHPRAELSRIRDEPALGASRPEIARLIEDVDLSRIEPRRVGQTHGVSGLGRQEVRRGRRLRRNRDDGLRGIVGQDVGRTGAVEVGITDPVAATDRGLVEWRVGEPEPRPEIVPVRIDQIPVGFRRAHHGLRGRVEVGGVVVALPERRDVLVAQAEVHGELVVDADVVLHVRKMHVAPELRDHHVGEVVLRAQSQEEVGNVVDIARRGARRPAELT